jgi:predicted RNase H-like HicB family nuclease
MARLEDYAVVTRPDDNGTFVAYVPAIDGCHALGRTPGEAQSELRHVFQMLQEEYQSQGRELPQDFELIVAHTS